MIRSASCERITQLRVRDAQARNRHRGDAQDSIDAVLRLDLPDAVGGEVEPALDLALLDRLKWAHQVRVSGRRRSNGNHPDETASVLWEHVRDDVKGTSAG